MNLPTSNIRAAVFIILSSLFFIVSDGFTKSLADDLIWYQLLLLRGFFASIILFGLAFFFEGAKSLGEITAYLREPLIALRIVFDILGATFWSIALLNMPFSAVIAINQLLPIFLALGGIIVFREKLGRARLLPILLSFGAAMLIVKPGSSSFTPFALLAILATAMMAARDVTTRALSASLPSVYIAALGMFSITLFSCIWLWSFSASFPVLSPSILLRVSASSVGLSLAFILVLLGSRCGELVFLAPFRYSNLLAGVMIALIFFSEVPDILTVLGSVLVVLCGLCMMYIERRQSK